jgi:UDP-glucose 4-epimerase
MKHPSVLLLGGGGFFGSALAERLCKKGWRVHAVGHSLVGMTRENIIGYQGDIGDRSLVEPILSKCDVLVHLASGSTPGSSAGKPLVEAEINLVPTLKLLDIFKDCENQRMIFISSGGTLYGNPKTIPVDEKRMLQPLSYHGAGKIAIEAFLQAFANDSGKEVTILRPPNVYGPGQSLRQGFGFVRTVLEHARQGTEIEIWGDGSVVRDFLYIQDMINGIEAVIDAKPHTDVYNVGYGKGYSLNEVMKTVEQVCNRKLKVKYLPARKVDVKQVVLDCAKIKKRLGWKPETPLKEGIGLTWEWMLQQKSLE